MSGSERIKHSSESLGLVGYSCPEVWAVTASVQCEIGTHHNPRRQQLCRSLHPKGNLALKRGGGDYAKSSLTAFRYGKQLLDHKKKKELCLEPSMSYLEILTGDLYHNATARTKQPAQRLVQTGLNFPHHRSNEGEGGCRQPGWSKEKVCLFDWDE